MRQRLGAASALSPPCIGWVIVVYWVLSAFVIPRSALSQARSSGPARWWERSSPDETATGASGRVARPNDAAPASVDRYRSADAAPLASDIKPAEDVLPYALRPRPSYAWRWKQLLVAPREGGRLTALAVDPQNANRIFVGTEAHRLLRSTDGGVTWDAIDLSPFTRAARDFHPQSPNPLSSTAADSGGFSVFVDPPFREHPAYRVVVPGNVGLEGLWSFDRRGDLTRALGGRSERPQDLPRVARRIGAIRLPGGVPQGGAVQYMRPLNVVPSATPAVRTLEDAVQTHPVEPVRQIVFCPGTTYGVFVVTKRELLGSRDDGDTWVRLLRLPGTIAVHQVVCGSRRPDDMVVVTSFGPFLSFDGGISWDQDLSGWPGRNATAAAFDPTPGREHDVFLATGADLFVGDPRSREGLEWIYPDFNNTETLPWTRINSIGLTKTGYVWLATDDGVRLSRDRGQNWNLVSGGLFNRQLIAKIKTGRHELDGGRVVALVLDCSSDRVGSANLFYFSPWYSRWVPRCRGSLAYASDDQGQIVVSVLRWPYAGTCCATSCPHPVGRPAGPIGGSSRRVSYGPPPTLLPRPAAVRTLRSKAGRGSVL